MDVCQGLVCFGIFLVGVCFLLRELLKGYVPIFRRFSKNPRFGLLTLLEMFLGAAVFFALLQWIDGFGALRYFLALLATATVVGLIHLVFGDAFELFTHPGKPKEPTSDDPWEEPEQQRIEFGPDQKPTDDPPPDL